jgi:hypothetical protein
MADTLWVRIKTGFHGHLHHALRPRKTSETVCGLEVGEDDEVVNSVSVTDFVCDNCLRLLAIKGDVEVFEDVDYTEPVAVPAEVTLDALVTETASE